MSSIPGYTLEAYLMWEFNITVEGCDDVNFSVGAAEVLSSVPKRPNLTKSQFNILVIMFESLREKIEGVLVDFDEEVNGWRTYAGHAFDFIGEDLNAAARTYLKHIVAHEYIAKEQTWWNGYTIAVIANSAVDKDQLRQLGEYVDMLLAGTVDMCGKGHKFIKLPDHPKEHNWSVCTYCAAERVKVLRDEYLASK